MNTYNRSSVRYIIQTKVEDAITEVMQDLKVKKTTTEQNLEVYRLIDELTDVVDEVYNINLKLK